MVKFDLVCPPFHFSAPNFLDNDSGLVYNAAYMYTAFHAPTLVNDNNKPFDRTKLRVYTASCRVAGVSSSPMLKTVLKVLRSSECVCSYLSL